MLAVARSLLLPGSLDRGDKRHNPLPLSYRAPHYRMIAEDSSLLVVLLETHANLWAQLPSKATGQGRLSASAFVEQVRAVQGPGACDLFRKQNTDMVITCLTVRVP